MLRTCPVCGKRVETHGRGNGKRFCSVECRAEGRKRSKRRYYDSPKGIALRDSQKARRRLREGRPATPKATDVYIPDDAARARAAITNEFRRQTRARSY